jgi:GTP-binding protein HflX
MERADPMKYPQKGTAVLIMREDPNGEMQPERMAELRGLARSAGYRVLAEIKQRRGRDRKFQIGRGKIEEALEYNPEKLIFYNPLSPGQVYNIGKDFDIPAIDRFNLILEIFAARASSREAKLQVELARLTYEAPFVRTMISLRKLSERPGYRGAGRYEESMYQDIQGRMAKIRAALRSVEQMSEDRRRHRRKLGFDLVALAGYTNAGKSTLLNVLSDESVEADDRPFTTLSPTTRAVSAEGRSILLTDTVGFIEDLPHFLIKAFRSTLAEITCADLILLVVDLSDPDKILRKKLVACHSALWDCGSSAPIITVLNKVDRVDDEEVKSKLQLIEDLAPNPVAVSAVEGYGLEELMELARKKLPDLSEVQISLPYTQEGLSELSRLYDMAEQVHVSYEDEMVVDFQCRPEKVRKVLRSKEF